MTFHQAQNQPRPHTPQFTPQRVAHPQFAHPQPVPQQGFGTQQQLSQTAQTSSIADETVGSRMGKALFKAKFTGAGPWAGVIGTAIGISTVRFIIGFRSSEELSAGGHALRFAVTFAVVFVFALIITAIIAAIQSVTLPAKFRTLVPAGAPMSAEFAPTWAGLRAGQINERVEHSTITGTRLVNDMLLVFVKDAKAPVIFPGELLPAQVADDYLTRFSFEAIAAAKKG